MRNFVALLGAAIVTVLVLVASDLYLLKKTQAKVVVIEKSQSVSPPSSQNVTEMSQDTKLHLIRSSFRVATPSGSGTGFCIFSGKRSADAKDKHYYNYLITCSHVVHNTKLVMVHQFHYFDDKLIYAMTAIQGSVVVDDSEHDLALIEVRTDEPFETVSLVKPDDFSKMRLAEPVWVCGCGLGDPPYVSSAGSVAVFDANFIQVTSPIIFGNSGGGVYTADGKMIGVARAIPILHNGQVYPNKGICVPVWTVAVFLRINGYGFLDNADDGSSLDKLFEIRKEAQEKAQKIIGERALKKMFDDLLKDMVPPELPEPPVSPLIPDNPNQEHKQQPDSFRHRFREHFLRPERKEPEFR